MRRLTSQFRRTLVALLLALAVLSTPAMQFHVSADQYDTKIAQLRQQIATMRAQMGSVGAEQQAAAQAAAAIQQALAQTQVQLASTQAHLNAVNAEIATTTERLVQVTAQLATDRQHLATVMKSIYEMDDSGAALWSVINASSISDLTRSLIYLQRVNSSMTTLTNAVQADMRTVSDLRAREVTEQAEVVSTMNSLQALQASQETQEIAYQRQSAALTGQAASINAQIGAAQAQIVQLQAAQAAAASASSGGWVTRGNALPPFNFGPRFDAFPWGQCTWYVASLRDVPWNGDAWAWAGNARAYGYSEGMTPQPEAIVVWGAGNGYSGYGHVAYVVAVTGPASFIVDEANYLGLGVVNQRQVTSLNDVEAFIY